MVGGGQLGRMFCFAAQAMGYRVAVLDPDEDSPAGAVADRHLRAAYDDEAALTELGAAVRGGDDRIRERAGREPRLPRADAPS